MCVLRVCVCARESESENTHFLRQKGREGVERERESEGGRDEQVGNEWGEEEGEERERDNRERQRVEGGRWMNALRSMCGRKRLERERERERERQRGIYKRFFQPQGRSIRGFFVGYFIKYGQYRSIKVNHSQLRLIKFN